VKGRTRAEQGGSRAEGWLVWCLLAALVVASAPARARCASSPALRDFPLYAGSYWVYRGLYTVGGKRHAPVYRLSYRSLPDDTQVDFVPGLGIVRDRYLHHGSALAWDLSLVRLPSGPAGPPVPRRRIGGSQGPSSSAWNTRRPRPVPLERAEMEGAW